MMVNKAKINKKINLIPFRPLPATNQPSLEWTKMIAFTRTNIVIIHAHFTYLLLYYSFLKTTIFNLTVLIPEALR